MGKILEARMENSKAAHAA